ncbi:hypothetical protein C6Y10_15160, partial [Lactiplantibacillus pentosus]|uniref:hypothetical protein n=1 Tax=Lactiplantibacillus pentosus TaxID=1589 RepID=UPI000D014BA2
GERGAPSNSSLSPLSLVCFRPLPRMPGGRRRTHLSISFTLTRFVSSGSQLAAFELRNWHDLIMINAKLTSAKRLDVNQNKNSTRDG